jgi:hypothetical protein
MATPVCLACCSVHLQTKAGKKAVSTTSQEIADNLSLMLKHFEAESCEKPILVMDNARIQSCIPADFIESHHGDIFLQTRQRVPLPPHSPDLNQVAEQSVGAVKEDVVGQVADHVQANKGGISPQLLTRMGKQAADNFAAGKVFKDGVRHSVHRMTDVYSVVGADVDTEVAVAGHGTMRGTAGDWAPSPLH